MFKIATGLLALCGGLVPQCSGPAQTPPVQAPIEHVVFDGDEGNIGDVTPPDTITVRMPGFDGYDDAAARERCADMGGDFTLRNFGAGLEATCQDIDY